MSRQPRRRTYSFRFLLDENISQEVAVVARNLGLDVVSIYEIGRDNLEDPAQLELAAVDRRILVTRDRDDFLFLEHESCERDRAHAGILIVSKSVISTRPEPLAYALLDWAERMTEALQGRPLGPYYLDFVSAPKRRLRPPDD